MLRTLGTVFLSQPSCRALKSGYCSAEVLTSNTQNLLMMLGCYLVCQRGYQQGKQRHCFTAVMEILSFCSKWMNTTGYLLSRFARNLNLYTLKYGRKKLNYIQYSFLGSVEDVDKCCGMPNKSIHF